MIPAVKSELRKLYTLRSTYLYIAVGLILPIIFGFINDGLRNNAPDVATKLNDEVLIAASIAATLGGLVALLHATQEYRYNTITYTLTAARSRTRVLFAKVITVSIFGIGFAVLIGAYAAAVTYLGTKIGGHHLVAQDILFKNLFMRAAYVGWAYAMIGLLIGLLVRIQVGAFVMFFLIPSTVEPLLGLLLKSKSAYVPFQATSRVLQNASEVNPHALSIPRAAIVSASYIVVTFIVAWILFVKRDAN